MGIAYKIKKLTLFFQDKQNRFSGQKNTISTPDSGEYENNYISC